MAWFAAHAIIYFKLKDQPQDIFTVWENIYLIEAENGDDALAKALILGKQDEGDDDNSLTVDDQPAMRILAGIRKVISVSHSEDEQLRSGDELTYSELQVSNEDSIRKLATGDSVTVEYID